MGENNDLDSAEAQLLIERIEVASEIVRSSQAAVAFQRAFYLEVLTFDRVENEIDEFTKKIKKLQEKLSTLFNELQQQHHTEHDSGAAGRASIISEKLEILKNSYDDFKKRVKEDRKRREVKYQELNDLVLPALNSIAGSKTETLNWNDIQAVNLMTFVNDDEYHLAEEISEEWSKIRRKVENYLFRYVEETTSLRVEVFGATYAEQGNLSPHLEESSSGRSVMRKLSNLMSIRKSSTSSNGSRRSASRSESFFYCSHTAPKRDEGTVEVQAEITPEDCHDPEDVRDQPTVEMHESGF